MENSVIAVRIANGTFVPVLSSSSKKRRKLVVTTVRDQQSNVKIELFRGSTDAMADAEYIGSLVIDEIEPQESGAPDISVLLGVDESGNLNATAKDDRSGEYQSLSLNLEQVGSEGGYDVPDFQLSDQELTLDDLSMDEEPLESVAGFEDGDELPLSETEETSDAAALSAEALPTEESDDFDEISLDELTLEDEPGELSVEEPAAAEELDVSLGETDGEMPGSPASVMEPELAEQEDELGDLTFDEVGLDEESTDELEELSLDDLSTDELSTDDLSSDDELLSLDIEDETQPLAAGDEVAGAEVAEDELSGDAFTLDDASIDEISLEDDVEESDELGAPDESDESALGFDRLETEEDDELGDLSFDAVSDEDDLTAANDLAALTDSSEATGGLDQFSDDEISFDDSLTEEASVQDGMVEADLGEEDFTFDDTADDEPLFEAPADADTDSDLSFDETSFDEGSLDDDSLADPSPGTASDFGESELTGDDDSLSPEEFDQLDSAPDHEPVPDDDETPLAPRKSNGVIFAGYLVLALAAIGVLTYLVFRLMEGPPAPPLRAGVSRFAGLLLLAFPRIGRRR